MTELTPLVVSHKDVLRHLAKGDATAADIATATSRVASNVKRDLPKLAGESLVAERGERWGLTLGGVAAVEALDRAESADQANAVRGATDAPAGFVWLTHAEIQRDPNNARVDFDDESLGELADSMTLKGLLQKPAVRPPVDGVATLVAGERRWRAWGLLIERGVWTADHRELCTVVDGDDAHVEEAGLIENLQRKDLKPLEEARGFKRLIEAHAHTTATIAEQVGFTQRFVQQRLQLLDLKADDMKLLERGVITIEEARRRLAAYPKPLTPRALLALVELFDKRVNAPLDKTSYWKRVECRARTEREDTEGQTRVRHVIDDPFAKELLAERLIERVQPIYEASIETGRHQVGIEWHTESRLEQELPGSTKTQAKRSAHIEHLRTEVLGVEAAAEVGEGAYATAWLNGPFEVDPSTAEAIAQAKAAEAERQANWRAEDERRQAERAAKEAQAAAARIAALDTAKTVAPGAPVDSEALKDAFAGLAAPLPWAVVEDEDGDLELVDAAGEPVELQRWNDNTPIVALLMALANSAIGEAPRFKVEELDREAFEQAMAEALEDAAEDSDVDSVDFAAQAKTLLDGYMERKGIAYGEDCNVWTAKAARALANDLADEAAAEASEEPATAELEGAE